ncbi:MAG: hypothetical protein AAGE94_21485 [Acidobacteriota bacterium]
MTAIHTENRAADETGADTGLGSTTAVRLNGRGAPRPTVLQDLTTTAKTLIGRLVLYGGVAALLVFVGALLGIWRYAADQELPPIVREIGLFAPYVEAIDARRAADRTDAAWRTSVDERLETMHGDMVTLISRVQQGSSTSPTAAPDPRLDTLIAALTDHDLQSQLHGDIRWCTALALHDMTADACDGVELDIRPASP